MGITYKWCGKCNAVTPHSLDGIYWKCDYCGKYNQRSDRFWISLVLALIGLFLFTS